MCAAIALRIGDSFLSESPSATGDGAEGPLGALAGAACRGRRGGARLRRGCRACGSVSHRPLDVVAGHAAPDAGAGDRGQVDRVLASEASDGGSRASLERDGRGGRMRDVGRGERSRRGRIAAGAVDGRRGRGGLTGGFGGGRGVRLGGRGRGGCSRLVRRGRGLGLRGGCLCWRGRCGGFGGARCLSGPPRPRPARHRSARSGPRRRGSC